MIKRFTAIIFSIGITLISAAIGIYGIESILVSVFGAKYFATPMPLFSLPAVIFILSVCFGVVVSCVGSLFVFIIPLSIKYPKSFRTFYIGKRSNCPSFIIKTLDWYGDSLKECAVRLKSDA